MKPISNIQIKHIRTLEEFATLKDSWAILYFNRPQKTAFLTWEWLYTWWKNFGENKELWLLTAWKEERLVGAAPLMLSKEKRLGLGYRLLQSLGKPNTDEGDFLAIEDAEQVINLFFDYLDSQKRHWDAIEFCELNSESPTAFIIGEKLKNFNLVIKRQINPHFYIRTSESWDEYWKSISKNTRESVEKRLRQGKKKFSLEFQYIKSENVKWEHFDIVSTINQNAKYSDKYGSPKEFDYLRDLLSAMQGKGWLEVIILYMEGKPVAYDYGFNMEGKFEDWRTGYDTGYATQAVGKLLLFLMIQYQFQNEEYHHFDFLRGAYEYKAQWNPQSRDYINLVGVKPYHIPARLSLITLPIIWEWIKRKILKRKPT